MALAASWKPFVKSKPMATMTTTAVTMSAQSIRFLIAAIDNARVNRSILVAACSKRVGEDLQLDRLIGGRRRAVVFRNIRRYAVSSSFS